MDDENCFCPMCEFDNEPIGQLGNKIHYTCRMCGFWYSENKQEQEIK